MSDNYSSIKEIDKTVHITLPSFYVSNSMRGVMDVLEGWRTHYVKLLDGIVLDFKNVCFVDPLGRILADEPFIHYEIKAKFSVFKPSVGNILKGVINRISRQHVGCVVHDSINASIELDKDMPTDLGSFLEIGNEIIFCVTRVEINQKSIRVNGKITPNCIELMNELLPKIAKVNTHTFFNNDKEEVEMSSLVENLFTTGPSAISMSRAQTAVTPTVGRQINSMDGVPTATTQIVQGDSVDSAPTATAQIEQGNSVKKTDKKSKRSNVNPDLAEKIVYDLDEHKKKKRRTSKTVNVNSNLINGEQKLNEHDMQVDVDISSTSSNEDGICQDTVVAVKPSKTSPIRKKHKAKKSKKNSSAKKGKSKKQKTEKEKKKKKSKVDKVLKKSTNKNESLAKKNDKNLANKKDKSSASKKHKKNSTKKAKGLKKDRSEKNTELTPVKIEIKEEKE